MEININDLELYQKVQFLKYTRSLRKKYNNIIMLLISVICLLLFNNLFTLKIESKNGSIKQSPSPAAKPREKGYKPLSVKKGNDEVNIRAVNTALPDKVKWALNECAPTILKYEVQGGKLADNEIVMAVLTRRLLKLHKQHPSWTTKQLINKLIAGWNPNLDKTFTDFKRRAKPRTLQEPAARAILNAKNLNFETNFGKKAWKEKMTHFQHPVKGRFTASYKNYNKSFVFQKNEQLKYTIACAREQRWL